MKLGGIFFCVQMILCLFFCDGNVFAEEKKHDPGQLYALSAVLMDGDTGRVLYEKEGDIKRANASTTKIMTCILALENADISEEVQVSERAEHMPKVRLGIKAGQSYKLEDLLYSLMLESHNDVAVAIAEHVGGSVEGFSDMMNTKAKAIGCKNTLFLTPNGLDEEKDGDFHGTTAEDLARIMKYCVWDSPKREEFLKITQTREHSFSGYSCRNHNAFLNQNSNCISGKTGFTGEAGYCYVCAIESEGKRMTIALLGCGWPNNKNYKWKDASRLFLYGDTNFHIRNFPAAPDQLEPISLLNGANKEYQLGASCIKLYPKMKVKEKKMLLGDWEQIEYEYSYPKQIMANNAGKKKVGIMKIRLGETEIGEYKISVNCPVEVRTVRWYFIAVLRKLAALK